MKILNKPTLMFLFVIFILFFVIFQFLQSPKVAELIADRITKNILIKEGFEVDFEKVDLRIFPPATYFKNFKVAKLEEGGLRIELEAKRIGFHFGLLDFFSSKFIVSKVSIYDAVARVNLKKEKGPKKKIDIETIKQIKISEIQSFYKDKIFSKIPFILRELELDEVDVHVDDMNFLLDQLNLKFFKRSFSLTGRLEKFKFFKTKGWSPDEQELVFDINLTKERLRIKEVSFKDREDRVGIRGDIKNGDNGLKVEGFLSFVGRVENVIRDFDIQRHDDLIGLLDANIEISNDLFNPDAKIKAKFFDLESRYEKVQLVNLEAEKKANTININKIRIREKFAEINLKSKIVIPNYKKINLEKIKARFELKNFPTGVALYYVKALTPIKGLLNGELDVYLKNKDIHFEVLEGFRLDKFKLWFPDTKIPLLSNKRITAKKGEVVIKDNGNVSVDFDFIFPNSRIVVAGEVFDEEDRLEFATKVGTVIDFEKLGPIAGVQLLGKGPMGIKIAGPNDNVVLNLLPEMDGFSVLGFNFGKTEGEIDYVIKDDLLSIKNLNSIHGRSEINGKGSLTFGDSPRMDLVFEKPRATYEDSLEIYETLTKNMEFLPADLNLDYSASFKVKGPMDLKKLVIDGQLKAGNNSIYFENINAFESKFQFKNNKVKLYDFKVLKGKGIITGEFNYNLYNNNLNYNGKISGVLLSDIEVLSNANLGFDGSLEGEFEGERKSDFFKSSNLLNIKNGIIDEEKIEDSTITITSEGKKVFSTGNFFGQKISFNSFFNFNKKEPKNLSYFNIHIKTDEIKELLGFLSTHNIVDEGLAGEIDADFKSTFNIFDINKITADLNLKTFEMIKDEITLTLDENAKNISIENGKIKTWDLAFKDRGNYIRSKGEGAFYKKFKIVADHKINTNVFKVLSPKIKIIEGISEGKMMFLGNKDEILTSILFSGDLEKLSIQGVPSYFEDVDFNLSLENKDLLIQKFHGRYGKGEVDLQGNIYLDYPTPSLALDYNFTNIKFPILGLKKSYVLVSGRGIFEGEEIPYDLSGKYSIVYGDLRNEINEYYPSVKDTTFYEKYLPKELIKKSDPYLNLDLDLNITTPIELRNSLAEIFFGGNFSVTGTDKNPIFNGKISVVPEKSRVVFKGNEFDLLVGELELINTPLENPRINFVGTSKIKEYDVKFGLEGVTDKISIDLSSDPFLTKEDILSLLTLGITTEDAQGLSESEKQAITSVGLGSLLADQLKINQGLSSGLGLRLSVIPDVEEDTDYSGNEGREGVVNPYATRYKSATSVMVKKQITKKINLSVSSRVGGSIDQKQRMSADFYINKNMSLEGVYELKTTQDANISNITNAFGADLIFKWSFK